MSDNTYMAITLENVRLLFRNFKGAEGKFNTEGKRNFCVVLSDVQAAELIANNFNVKYLRGREENDDDLPYLKVHSNFGGYKDPIVKYMTFTPDNLDEYENVTYLDEDSISILDSVTIANVDLAINSKLQPDTKLRTCYLDKMFVSVIIDELEAKYSAKHNSEEGVVDAICVGPHCPII